MSPPSERTGRKTNGAKQSPSASARGESDERPGRRKRLQLSCRECRKKKLSCDRKFPCQRCVRTGRPQECSFENAVSQPLDRVALSNQQSAQHQRQEILDLKAEIAQLQKALVDASSVQEGHHVTEARPQADLTVPPELNDPEERTQHHSAELTMADPRLRSPHVYYGQHVLLLSFQQIPQLFPFIKETVMEWLKPLGVGLRKAKIVQTDPRMSTALPYQTALQDLLPSQSDTDILVSFYLDHFEQLHRIVHVPSFRRDYTKIWTPGQTACQAVMALVLSMLSISICATMNSPLSAKVALVCRTMPPRWILACEEWLRQQSPKHRRLVYHQVSCLVYLAKRMNMIGKKRFWRETGSIAQDAILDGLHHEPVSKTSESCYMRELKRRLWTVVRELDLQNTFEYGLPTLLYSLVSDTAHPTNTVDESFEGSSLALPEPMPLLEYTSTSYQCHSSLTWTLRLEISQRLFATGVRKSCVYEDVLSYTHKVTQAIHCLPPWNTTGSVHESIAKSKLLAYALLYFQLAECIFALHQPYIQQGTNRNWLSENICHQMSRDVLALNDKLAELGVQGVVSFREDLLLATLSVTQIMLLQPKDISNAISTTAESSLGLLERCLVLAESRYLSCITGEPWCFMTLCVAIKLLKVHLGKETRTTAKSLCAQKFLELYHRHISRAQPQQTALVSRPQGPEFQKSTETDSNCVPSQSPWNLSSAPTDFEASWWMDSNFSDISAEAFDLDFGGTGMWES